MQPTYWLDSHVGVQYSLNVRVPEYRMTSLSDLNSMPITAGAAGDGNEQMLANLATFTAPTASRFTRITTWCPVIDVFGGVDGRDLGGVLGGYQADRGAGEKERCRAAAPSSCAARRRPCVPASSVWASAWSMAIALIYLLLVVNFQSWLDPFIILTALTGALAGVVWGLFLTATTLSVPAMMGAIMCLGVATANSVLVVTFARDNSRKA